MKKRRLRWKKMGLLQISELSKKVVLFPREKKECTAVS